MATRSRINGDLNAVRFGSITVSWGSVNEDAADAGWGMPPVTSSQPGGTVNDLTDNG
jgi:hypothetical protein